MRIRTLRRAFARLLDKKTGREMKEHRRRAGECEQAFHKLNAAIPGLNAAAVNASEDPMRLAEVLHALSLNYAASAAVLAQWSDTVLSASKLIVKE